VQPARRPPPPTRHAFAAQVVEVRVDVDSGEVRVPRLLGVFAAGRILNPRTARSQFIGGMTMGMAMALLEESSMGAEFGDYLNHGLAQYHVPHGLEGHRRDRDRRHGRGRDERAPPRSDVRFRDLPVLPARIVDALTG
jgi:xanthine dehydrogenase molybdopterin-binding subunit B